MPEHSREATENIASVSAIPPLIATSVVRGSEQGQSHGGVYLIDPATQSVRQTLDWNTLDIDWSGRGLDRGLRGIAFWNDEIYIAASDELFVYDRQFKKLRSYRCRFLKHCHEISVHRDVLYLTSTGFDSILAFNLPERRFIWGLQAVMKDGTWRGHRFDPVSDTGPDASSKLHINFVKVDDDGLCFSGLRTNGIIGLGAELRLLPQVELPQGTHNAQIFGDGVLFNDTAADYLRYVSRDGSELQFAYPQYDPETIEFSEVDDSSVARQGFGRGLCIINARLVAVGSSPSTVSVFDLQNEQMVFSVNFSMDVRNVIHGLAVWPFAPL